MVVGYHSCSTSWYRGTKVSPRAVRLKVVIFPVLLRLYTQRNLIKSNQNQIVFTISRLIWKPTDVRLAPKSIGKWYIQSDFVMIYHDLENISLRLYIGCTKCWPDYSGKFPGEFRLTMQTSVWIAFPSRCTYASSMCISDGSVVSFQKTAVAVVKKHGVVSWLRLFDPSLMCIDRFYFANNANKCLDCFLAAVQIRK